MEGQQDHIANWSSDTLVALVVGGFNSGPCPSSSGHEGVQGDFPVSAIAKHLGDLTEVSGMKLNSGSGIGRLTLSTFPGSRLSINELVPVPRSTP